MVAAQSLIKRFHRAPVHFLHLRNLPLTPKPETTIRILAVKGKETARQKGFPQAKLPMVAFAIFGDHTFPEERIRLIQHGRQRQV